MYKRKLQFDRFVAHLESNFQRVSLKPVKRGLPRELYIERKAIFPRAYIVAYPLASLPGDSAVWFQRVGTMRKVWSKTKLPD